MRTANHLTAAAALALIAALGGAQPVRAAPELVYGFDVVVTTVPDALRGDRRPAAVRTLAKRIQRHGAVVVVLGEAGALATGPGTGFSR